MFNWHSLITICQSVTEIGDLQLKKKNTSTHNFNSQFKWHHTYKTVQLYVSNFQSRILVNQVLLWCSQIRNNLSTHFPTYITVSFFY